MKPRRKKQKEDYLGDSMTLLQCLALSENMEADMQALIDHDVEFAKAEIIKRDLGHLVESMRALVQREVG